MDRRTATRPWAVFGYLLALIALMAACAGGGAPTAASAPQQPAPAAQPQPAAPGADPLAPKPAVAPSGSQPSAMPEPAGAMVEEPKFGGILQVGHRNDPVAGYDNMRVTNLNNSLVLQTMFGEDNVVRNCREDATTFCSGLAESWEANDDFTVWTFKIREGVLWHDGTPLTADDVSYWMNLFSAGITVGDKTRLPGASRSWFAKMEKAETIPGNRVRVTMPDSDPLFWSRLANHHAIAIAHPRHLAKPEIDAGNVDVSPFELGLVGTGPFMFKAHERGSVVEVRRFDRYWEKDEQGRQLPYLDGVDFLIIKDGTAAHAAFRTGRLDVGARGRGFYVQPDMLPAFERSLGDGFHYFEIAGGGAPSLAFNTLKPPFDDVRVRRAITLWIDRQSAIITLGQGFGKLVAMMRNTDWSNPDFRTWPGYNPDTKAADRAEAKRLLAEAGYANGLTFTITSARTMARAMEWWTGALAGSGITVKLKFLEVAANEETRSRSDYQATDGGVGSVTPENLIRTISTKEISPRAAPVHNDPKIAEFFDRLAREPSHDGRVEVFREFERYVLQEQVYTVVTFVGADLWVHRSYVKGQPAPALNGDFGSFATVWMDK